MGKIRTAFYALLVFAITLISLPAFGADAEVEYNTDSEGNNISIKSIKLDPYTYYDATDLIGGKTDLTPDRLEKVAEKLFEEWGPVAAEIFRNNTSATFHNDGDDDDRAEWDRYYGSGVSESDQYTDVKAALSGKKNPDQYSHGDSANDCVRASGLSYATNLDAIVMHMCQQIAEGMGNRYNTKGGTIYDKHDLKSVKDKKETKAYYRIVTSIDENGATYGYFYNSYALVLYDFELAPIVASGVTVTNAVEKEDNEGSKSGTAKSYFENRSQKPSTVSSNFSYSTSESIVNSITNTKTFGFTETIGTESEISSFLGIARLKQKFSLSASANQAVSTAIGEQKAITNTYTNTTTASVALPPHTSVSMLEDSGRTSSTITYDCPVALRYKAAVFSISGFRYDDRAAVTGWRHSKDFVTIFGTGTKDGGYDAPQNMYMRAISAKNKLERAYGSVKGNDGDRVAVAEINWDKLSSANEQIRNVATRIPMFSSGASMSLTKETKSTKLGDITPLYPLALITISAPKISFVESKDYSYGTFNFLRGTMNVGDSSFTDYIDLNALNRFGVEYYGFLKSKGTWTVTDESGKELPADKSPIRLEKNPVTKNTKFIAVRPGTCYLKYNINEDIYTSAEQPDGTFTQNADLLRTAAIELTVREEENLSSGETILVSGSYEGYVGETPADIDGTDGLVVSIRDASGKEIDKKYVWEAQELPTKGMTLNGNKVSFTRAGTFHVRAVSGELESDWVSVTSKVRTYEITFDPQNGEKAETVTVKSGEKAAAKTLKKEGCRVFAGWCTDAEGKKPYDFAQPVNKDLKLYALWADSHDLKKTKARAATCEKDGNIEYYTCSACEKLFADAEGKKEIKQEVTVLKATGHQWGEWKVTRAATVSREGIEKRTCEHNAAHTEKRTIPKLVKKVKTNQFIRAYVSRTTKNAISIRWTKLKDAKQYVVYAGECGDALEKACTLNSVNRMKRFKKIGGQKIRQDRYYKFFVAAYGLDEKGSLIEIGRTPVIHSATGTLSEYRNYGKVVLKTGRSLKLSVGGRAAVKAVQKKTAKGKAEMHQKVYYLSTDPAVAKVGITSGKVVARAAGKCVIYCLAQNGAYKTVKVTVR